MNIETIYDEFEGLDSYEIVDLASKRVRDLMGVGRKTFLEMFYNGDFQNNVDPTVLEAMYYLPLLEAERPCECGATVSRYDPLIGDDVFDDTIDNWFHWYSYCFDTDRV